MEKRIIDWIVMELGERKVWLAKGPCPSCLWQREPKGNHCHPFLPVTGVLLVQENSTSFLAFNESRFFTNFWTYQLAFYFSMPSVTARSFRWKDKNGVFAHVGTLLFLCYILKTKEKSTIYLKLFEHVYVYIIYERIS